MTPPRALLPMDIPPSLRLCTVFLAAVLSSCSGHRPRHYTERDYQQAWCGKNHGKPEYRLDDGTRVDCLTSSHAVEFDFPAKWAEATGQSLYYALKTGREPAVVMIRSTEEDERFLKRMKALAARHGITVWTMTPADLK